MKDIKKTWIGIKSLVSMKQKQCHTIHNQKWREIRQWPNSNCKYFQYFFTSIAETVQSKIKFSNKSFLEGFYQQQQKKTAI